MRLIYLYLLLVLFFTTTSMTCYKDTDTCHHSIVLQNNSTQGVYFYVVKDSSFAAMYNPFSRNDKDKKCAPQATVFQRQSTCWEHTIAEDTQQKLYPIVFDADVIETQPWDTIIAKRLYLKRYELSAAELQSIGWKINYP